MRDIIPDKKWYSDISAKEKVLPRCPFATADSCPRFYQSLSLLGSAGCTSIPVNEEQRLLEKWEASDLWPLTGEQATSISGPKERFNHFSNFCPEVSFDNFGYFATALHRHIDEIDTDVAHNLLKKKGAPPHHWGWAWSSVTPMHYTDCHLYSILAHRSNRPSTLKGSEIQKSQKYKPIKDLLVQHVFISYVRENSDQVDLLANTMRNAGINVWLDTGKIKPGQKWKSVIRNAIREGALFIACFSNQYTLRDRTYMNEELTLAIEELRLK
jgi:hypothetical protein